MGFPTWDGRIRTPLARSRKSSPGPYVLRSHVPCISRSAYLCRAAPRAEAQMGGYKAWHDAIHDHQVESFASENGLTADLVWELILKYGNSRKAVIKAAQGLKAEAAAPDDDRGPRKAIAGLPRSKPQIG